MSFTEFETKVNDGALKWFVERRRPPEHIRLQLDLAYRIEGQTVDLYSIRPDWKDKTKTRHEPIARIKFVRTQEHWKLYWMRADLKWHGYEPVPVHSTLKSALQTVDEDAYCCFFG
ncbi:MAG: hypothetical protein RLZZ598_1704 [Pseudomonadota bacterium]